MRLFKNSLFFLITALILMACEPVAPGGVAPTAPESPMPSITPSATVADSGSAAEADEVTIDPQFIAFNEDDGRWLAEQLGLLDCTEENPFRRAWHSSENVEPTDKVFWRITFKVVCGKPMAYKEIAIWRDRDTRFAQQLILRAIQPLECSLKGEVDVTSDTILLEGNGHIECHEPASLGEVVAKISDDQIFFCDEGEQCERFAGESIALHAEIRQLSGNESLLIHYPQLHSDLEFYLKPDRDMSFFLSGAEIDNLQSYQLGDDAWHSVQVRQQQSAFVQPDTNLFNFLVDGFGLTQRILHTNNFNDETQELFRSEGELKHLFSSDNPQTLTIGEGFHGEIREIIVDPSDTCLSCYPVFFRFESDFEFD